MSEFVGFVWLLGTTSSMMAAICYAWLRENGAKQESAVVVPVVNMLRGKMWKNKQAAWLFHNFGIDASALIFTDEVMKIALMVSLLVLSFPLINHIVAYMGNNSRGMRTYGAKGQHLACSIQILN